MSADRELSIWEGNSDECGGCYYIRNISKRVYTYINWNVLIISSLLNFFFQFAGFRSHWKDFRNEKSIKKYLNSIVQPSWENLRLQYIRAIILLYQIVSQVNLYIIDLEYKL